MVLYNYVDIVVGPVVVSAVVGATVAGSGMLIGFHGRRPGHNQRRGLCWFASLFIMFSLSSAPENVTQIMRETSNMVNRIGNLDIFKNFAFGLETGNFKNQNE